MNHYFSQGIKRVSALAMSLLIVILQLAAPISAFAVEVDPALLPKVTLTYQLADQDENPTVTTLKPDLTGAAPIYWAQIPAEAFPYSITLEVTGSENSPYIFSSSMGYDLGNPTNSTAVDGVSYATTIDVNDQNNMPIASYPLYLSSIPMPPPISATVYIHYMGDMGDSLLEDPRQLAPGSYTISAEKAQQFLDQGYTLVSESSYDVTVNPDGSILPFSEVTFTFAAPVAPPDPDEGDGGNTGDGGGDIGGGGDTGGGDIGGGGDTGGGDPEQPAMTDVNLYGVTNAGVNLRREPDKNNNSVVIEKAAKETRVWVYAQFTANGDTWLKIRRDADSLECYVVASFVDIFSQEKTDEILAENSKPTQVTVNYVNTATNEVFYTEQASCNRGQMTTIYVKQDMAQGYHLTSEPQVNVNVGLDGSTDISPVVFSFEKVQVQGSVYVSYVDGTQEFAHDNLILDAGEHAIEPNESLVPAGYTFVSASAERVTVSQDGTVSPDAVIFTYKKPDVFADVTMRYLDSEDSNVKVAEDSVVQLAVGSNDVQQYQIAAPGGYTFSHANATEVVVDDNGNPSIAVVEFYYDKAAVEGKIRISYVDTAGEEIAQQREETLAPNVYSSSAFAIDPPAGYTYKGVSAESFTIDAAGMASPDTITFTYEATPIAPKMAEVTFLYQDMDKKPLAAAEKQQLSEGSYDSAAYMKDFAGYQFSSVDVNQIVVSADGVATPASVTFTYAVVDAPVVKGTVTFNYVSADNKQLSDPLVAEIEQGATNTSEYAAAFDGYTLQKTSVATVTVDASGKASPSAVTFTYAANTSEATVEVHYVNAIGEDLPGSPQLLQLGKGTHTVKPDLTYVPAGYTMAVDSAKSYKVEVDGNFVARPNFVSFTYYDENLLGKVEVHYVDASTGRDFAKQDLSLAPGQHVIEPDPAVVTKNYKIDDASITSATVNVGINGEVDQPMIWFYFQPVALNMYTGYAVTTSQTALRGAANLNDSSIKQTLPVNTLLYISGQGASGSVTWDSVQLVLGSTANGFVQDSAVRQIDKAEADRMIAEYNKNHPTVTVPPAQSTGYYITIVRDVPLRVVADPYAEARSYLKLNTVVYVMGQDYSKKPSWHIANYNDFTGYIREDQLRKMSASEVDAYLAGKDPSKPTQTGAPNDPYAKSSYGYVTSSSVNYRSTPNGTKIKTLNKYAMALIIGSKEINGVTWYYVNQSGVMGWVHGSYFHQMNIAEFNSFLGSKEYLQGLQSNGGTNSGGSSGGSGSGGSSGGSSGKPTQGNVSSVEDWNVGTWQNTGTTTQTSYAPFNPYATPSVSASVSPSASVQPTSTFAIGTMIPIDYVDESKETQTNTMPWGLIGAAVVLIGGAGGVYAYALNQNKKRKASARAAANRRAGVNGGQNAPTDPKNPYARRAVAAPPVSGSKQNAPTVNGANATPDTTTPFGGVKNPYSNGSITGAASGNPYNKPTDWSNPSVGASRPLGSTDASAGNPLGNASGIGTVRGNADASAQPNPSTPAGTNPYVRPMGAPSMPASTPAASETDNKQRSTRMQRYHEAEDGEKGNDEF